MDAGYERNRNYKSIPPRIEPREVELYEASHLAGSYINRNFDESQKATAAYQALRKIYEGSYLELEKALESQYRAIDAEFDAAAKTARTGVLLCILVGAVGLVVLTRIVSNSITGQLGMELSDATDVAHTIAKGDLPPQWPVQTTTALPVPKLPRAITTCPTALVDKAGATMTEVVSSIRRVTDIMGEISAASGEQAAGVAQIGEAVTHMDQTTQQNAVLVEQMAAASLRTQAQGLVEVVATFNTGTATVITKVPSRTSNAPPFLGVERRSATAV